MSVVTVEVISKEMKERYENGIAQFDVKTAEYLQRRGYVRILGRDIGKKEKSKSSNSTPKIFAIKDKRGEGIRIQIVIPYEPGYNIGYAYNRAIAESITEWVLFIDHDILLVNPLWYDICQKAISNAGENVGWITCYTNRIKCNLQKAPGVDEQNDDIKYHRKIALDLYNKNRNQLIEHTIKDKGKYSGFFILTNKKAHMKAGGFPEDTFFGVDNSYFDRLRAAGLRTLLIPELYVYHGYFRETITPIFGR